MKSDKKSRARKFSLGLGRRRNVYILVALALTVAAAGYLFINRTVVEEVSYEQCIKSYGDVVAEWEGEGSDLWDETGYYYKTMSFSLRAESPDVFWPNTAELEPTRISTGGEDACGDFDEQIDTASSKYRWDGARPVSLLFGGNNIGQDSSSFIHQPYRSDAIPHLATPVHSSYDGAAVWVDDGGSAELGGDMLWCVNDIDCDPISEVSSPTRGAGYLHTPESCPDGYECSDEWYDADTVDSMIDTGILEPFDLRLSALSTFAPKVGAEKLLTFRYPLDVVMDVSLSFTDPPVVAPGDDATFELDIDKKGRFLDDITIAPEDDSEIVDVSFTEDIKEAIDNINLNDHGSIEINAEISETADLGTCYEETLSVRAAYGGDEEVSESVAISYCIEAPATTYSYDIQTRGAVDSSVDEFAQIINDTLADGRGWVRADVRFEEVDSGGDFTMWLADPSEMTSFSTLCSPEYSCRVLDDVIINDERWRSATEPWNQAGGSLLDYRRMVINHEVGHFLGHGHYHCPEDGALAPVMQQQSIDLEGCVFNPWPLQFEIDAT